MTLSDQIAIRIMAWRLREAAFHTPDQIKDHAEKMWPSCKALGEGIVKAGGFKEDDTCPDF